MILNVSVRTLRQTFTAAEESVSAYIRGSQLELARHDLAVPLAW